MAIYIEGLLLRHMALAAYDGLDEFLELFPNQPAFDFHGHCHSTSRRVLTICKGFLEVQINPYDLLESYVTFVHRTAAEFLQEYEGAQTILNLEASVEVDIRLLHVKARIANLILNDFPQPDECHDADLISFARGIMRGLARCEQATEKTFAALTELLDRVLLSPTRWYNPSPVHWSVLSGLIEAEDSDMGDSVSRYPVDLLGNAARSGLRLYVLQSLDSDPALQKSRTMNYLLHCVIHQELPDELEVQHLRLISALLKRGASPNSVSEMATAWCLFLGHLYDITVDSMQHYGHQYRTHAEKICGDVVLAFLDSDTEIRSTYSCDFRLPVKWTNAMRESVPELENIFDLTLESELSPLTMLRYCLVGTVD
jgi:hypothetical protein